MNRLFKRLFVFAPVPLLFSCALPAKDRSVTGFGAVADGMTLHFIRCKGITLKNSIIRHWAAAPVLSLSEDSDVKVEGCYTDTRP